MGVGVGVRGWVRVKWLGLGGLRSGSGVGVGGLRWGSKLGVRGRGCESRVGGRIWRLGVGISVVGYSLRRLLWRPADDGQTIKSPWGWNGVRFSAAPTVRRISRDTKHGRGKGQCTTNDTMFALVFNQLKTVDHVPATLGKLHVTGNNPL